MRNILATLMVLLFLSSCELLEQKYSSVKITEIEISKMPFTNPDGLDWDILFGGPDVFCTISNSDNTILFTTSTQEDVSNTPFSISVDFEVEHWNDAHILKLWDADVTSSDFIGQTDALVIDFLILVGYPTDVTLENEEGTIKLNITLEWIE